MVEFIIKHGVEVGLVIMLVDKIVAKTPCKWDDLIFTSVKAVIQTIIPVLKK